MLYLLSYTGRWWGCLDSNQGTQRERIYSPPQLPLCHIPIPFSSRCSGLLLTAAEGIIRYGQEVVNVIHLAGRIHITVSPYWLVAVDLFCEARAVAGRCTGLQRKKMLRIHFGNSRVTVTRWALWWPGTRWDRLGSGENLSPGQLK